MEFTTSDKLRFILIISLCLTATVRGRKIQCLDADGQPVDWFIVYKLPQLRQEGVPDNTFYYMDTNARVWLRSRVTIDEKGHAVYNTLNQIYNSLQDELMYMMYNDQPPQENNSNPFYPADYGHIKGALAFDVSSTGFWLIHSTPQFPLPKKAGYKWPHNGVTNGQTFLCISLETRRFADIVGIQLQYTGPRIYDKWFPQGESSAFPNLSLAMNATFFHGFPAKSTQSLISLGKQEFRSLAKTTEFDKDLYTDYVAQMFEDSLYVQTWRCLNKQPLTSNCSGKYQVFNIDSVKFPVGMFGKTKDHSKWAVSFSSRWTCIGDINRTVSQMKRRGGTVCFQDKRVWGNFKALVNQTEPCNQQPLLC